MTNEPIHPSECRTLDPSNPFYPLPKDYDKLTLAGQKEARLKVVCDHSTPMKFVQAWDMFRRLYLQPTEPGFFYHSFVESPPFHYEMVHDMAMYGRNVEAAPRGTAKSVVIGTELPMFLSYTRPYFKTTLCFSTDRMVEERFDVLMQQYTQNPFLLNDFGPMKPQRGQAIWNRHSLHLLNGSQLNGISVTGRKRGLRPHLFILDDPEFDPTGEVSAVVLREKFEVFLFKQVIPMLEHGSGLFWIGTLIGSRSFLAHAVYGDDPRFNYWNRKVYQAIDRAEGKTSLLWEQKWSEDALDARREEIGDAAFATEYLNKNASSHERVFTIAPERNEYTLSAPITPDPYESTATVDYHTYDKESCSWVRESRAFKDFVSGLYIVVCTDYAAGLQAHHDYSCYAAMGIDNKNCLWVLDMWMGRQKEGPLMQGIFNMAMRWRARVVGIESVSRQKSFAEAAQEYFQKRLAELQQVDPTWLPRVMPVNYKDVKAPTAKANRIMTLEWRFPTGKIKYPGQLKMKWPWSMLYAQTQDFTMDLGLLRFDDAIDTVAQVSFVVHNKGRKQFEEPIKETVADMIRKGKTNLGGVPILSGMSPTMITADIEGALIDRSLALRQIAGVRKDHRVPFRSRPRKEIR